MIFLASFVVFLMSVGVTLGFLYWFLTLGHMDHKSVFGLVFGVTVGNFLFVVAMSLRLLETIKKIEKASIGSKVGNGPATTERLDGLEN